MEVGTVRPSFEKDIVSIESRIGCQFQVKVKHKKTVTSKLHILSRVQNPGWYSLPMASDHVACDLERYLLLQTLCYCYISYAYSFFDLVVFLFELLQGSALCLNTASLFHTVHDSFILTHWLIFFFLLRSTALLIPPCFHFMAVLIAYLWLIETHTTAGPIAFLPLISMLCWTSSNSHSSPWS